MKTKKIISSLAIFVIALSVSFAQSPNLKEVIFKKDLILKLNGTILVDSKSRIEIYAGKEAMMFDVYPTDTTKKTSLTIHWGEKADLQEIYFHRRGETAFWMINKEANGYYVTCDKPKADQKFIILDGKKCIPLSQEEITELNNAVDFLIATVNELSTKPKKIRQQGKKSFLSRCSSSQVALSRSKKVLPEISSNSKKATKMEVTKWGTLDSA